MNCKEVLDVLVAFDDGELEAGLAGRVEAHLAGCAACARELAALRGAMRLVGGYLAGAETSAVRVPAQGAVRRLWLPLAAAAALLAAGAVGLHLAGRQPPAAPPLTPVTEPVRLAGGTEITPAGEAWLQFLGSRGNTNQVIRLEAGEIRVAAAKAEPGRCAVRVETPLGNVETLGTVFRVKLVGPEREGEKNMKLRSVVPLAAVALLVAVDQGQVLVSEKAGLGQVVAQAGEGVAVGAADRVIKAMVTKVEDGKDGTLAVTIPAGKADGIREGFEFTCKAKDWTGKVVSVAEASAVLEVKAEAKGKVAVHDLAETKLTTIVADKPAVADPNPQPEPAPVKVEAIEGLQLILVKRENIFKYITYVDKEGKPIRGTGSAITGANVQGWKPPEGAQEKVQERKSQELVAQLKNVSDKAVVLGFTMSTMGYGMGASHIKLFAKDAEGKEVPRTDGYMPPIDKTGPAAVTILNPGQVLEQPYQWLPFRFPAEGKYIVWATLEDGPRPEVLPGVKPWSGKLKSNEVEWEYKGMKGVGWGPGAGGAVVVPTNPGGGPGQPTPQKEVF